MRNPFLTFAAPLAALLAAFAAGCGKQSPPPAAARPSDPAPDYVVALVNGSPLTWADMEKRAKGFFKDEVDTQHLIVPSNRLDEAMTHFRKRAINTFVYKTLMLEEAARQNLRLTDRDRQNGLAALARSLQTRNWTTNDFFLKGPMDEPTMRREFEDGLLIDKLLRVNVRDNVRVESADLERLVARINETNQLKRAQAEAVRKQLADGASFEDVARTVSECPHAKKGGDLGEVGRGRLPKPVEDAAFSQQVGQVGPVVESVEGYHILRVAARNPARAATASTPAIPETVRLSQILLRPIPVDRKRLNASILRTKYNKAVETYFTSLKSRAKIECTLYPEMRF